MPRSPGRSVVAVGGARPGVVIFPATDEDHSLPVSASASIVRMLVVALARIPVGGVDRLCYVYAMTFPV